MEDSTKVNRCRSISVKMYGQEHQLFAAFPKLLSTDLITLVECYRRCKPFKLNEERKARLEEALLEQGSGFPQLQEQIENIRNAVAEKFDASKYYDDDRVAAYTREFVDVQHKHTARCMFLLPELSDSVVLDLGCGSGLSTAKLCEKAAFVVGMDASEAMLRSAQADVTCCSSSSHMVDFVLADFNSPLPFRKDAFDHCSSTSAVHYVKQSHRPAFLTELQNIVTGHSAFQLFCRGGLEEVDSFRRCSPLPLTHSSIVVDKPHHKDERFYLLFSNNSPLTHENRCGCDVFGLATSLGPYRCLLSFPERVGLLEAGHWQWLQRDHERAVRRAERIVKRQRLMSTENEEPEKAKM